jgi:hypothetical protein
MRSAIQTNRRQASILQGLPPETPETPVLISKIYNLFNFFISLAVLVFLFISWYGLFCLVPESFPASHLVEDHRVHFLKGVPRSPHDDIGNTAVYDHLRAEETWPYLCQIISCDIKPRKIERAPACILACLEECIHLGMNAPTPLVVGAGRDIVVLSPARIEFRTVHLFARGPRVSGGNDRIVFIDDNRSEVAPKAGALVGTPQCEVKKIVMPIGPHEKKVWKSPVLKKHGLKQDVFTLGSYP